MTRFAPNRGRQGGGWSTENQETDVTNTSTEISSPDRRKSAPAPEAPARRKADIHPSLRALPDYPAR
jgi:hypothetical protein